jgi:hypothetical protein
MPPHPPANTSFKGERVSKSVFKIGVSDYSHFVEQPWEKKGGSTCLGRHPPDHQPDAIEFRANWLLWQDGALANGITVPPRP